MAWRIENIHIENFKFFKEAFDLPVEGNNILLYGENGSGKSSIYWSFYTIFQACLKANVQEAQKYFQHDHSQNLRNKFCIASDYSGIKITFRNGGTSISFEDSSERVCVSDSLHEHFMKLSMASSDFMNYKFLATLFDFSNSQENDIFEVLVKEVFPFLIFRDSLILDDGSDSQRKDADFWWKYLSQPSKHVPTRNNAPNGAYIVSSPKYRAYEERLYRFNQNLKHELSLIFNDANEKLKNIFNENISLSFKYEDATFNNRIGTSKSHDGKLHQPRIILTARMTDSGIIDNSIIEHPRSFFNEARLTCMALALRLAILDARVVAGDDFAPVIFIDDLLISLDMGCRQFVISLLLKYAEQKQMLIFSHDRAFHNLTWVEISRLKQKDKWKRFELYVNQDTGYNKPVLMQSESLVEKAKQKFRILDFAGCANTIRSACECELKRILPHNLVMKKQVSDDDPIQLNNLNALINNLSPFRKRFFDSNLNDFPDIVPNLSNERQLVLNPYSHDDIETPLYRRELKEAINNVEKLTQISKTSILLDEDVGCKEFEIEITAGGRKAYAKFVFIERFERIEYESIRYYSASKILVKGISDNSINTEKRGYTIRMLYKDLYESLGLTALTRPIFESCIKVSEDGTLISSL